MAPSCGNAPIARWGFWKGAFGPQPAAALLRAFVVASLFLLFLSAFGPLLDHHFAERIPYHAHVYWGGSGPGHSHPFEAPHGHVHLNQPFALGVSALPGSASGPDNTVYLVPDEGLAQSFVSMVFITQPSSPAFPKPPADLHRFALTGDRSVPAGQFVEPLKQPPRT